MGVTTNSVATAKVANLLDIVEEKVNLGQRLGFEDGLAMVHSDDIFRLGKLADNVARERIGEKVYYSLNRHINYTNICKFNCKFCGFKRWHGEEGEYTYSVEEMTGFAEKAASEGTTEIHIVGGIHPGLTFEYVVDMLKAIKQTCPDLHVKAFTAVEILDLMKKGKKSSEDCLLALMEAGLDALPGGGAEILDDDYFNQVCRSKSKPEIWIDIHKTAHRLGLMTNCTMLYGFIESVEQRIKHLIRLREIQDVALEGGKGHFQCYIPLPYLKPSFISRASDEHTESSDQIDAMEDLKTIAISRLMLDNIDNHKAFWPMQGANISQVALTFGSNDLDGTVKNYTIVDKNYDNSTVTLPVEKICEMIVETGRIPVQRDGFYNAIA